MKKLMGLMLIANGIIATTFSQTPQPVKKKDSTKFDFSHTNYKDSIAMDRAVSSLASQITKFYSDSDRRKYFENSISYYMLSENYTRSLELIDSVQKIDDDKSYAIEIKSYARAKIADKTQEGLFDKTFKKEFLAAFNSLSFRKRVAEAMVDSSYLDFFKTDYTSIKERLEKENKDSLSLEDARSLAEKYFYYSLY